MISLRTGEIWLANLNPNKGSEPGKIRPVLIIQNQSLLTIKHPTTLILPLTATIRNKYYPLRIKVTANNKLTNDSSLLIDQIRAIDNKRFIDGPLTILSSKQMKKIYKAINEVLGANKHGIG